MRGEPIRQQNFDIASALNVFEIRYKEQQKEIDYLKNLIDELKNIQPLKPEPLTGPAGPKGDKGEIGEQGMKGEKGDSGPQGIKGEQGIKGDSGEQGLKGDNGINGKDGTTEIIHKYELVPNDIMVQVTRSGQDINHINNAISELQKQIEELKLVRSTVEAPKKPWYKRIFGG